MFAQDPAAAADFLVRRRRHLEHSFLRVGILYVLKGYYDCALTDDLKFARDLAVQLYGQEFVDSILEEIFRLEQETKVTT
jgi:hypothetical protein